MRTASVRRLIRSSFIASDTLLGKLNYYLSAPLTLIKNDQNRDFFPINGILHIEEKNWFVLDSVVSPQNYTLSSDGIRPYLCIKLSYKNEKFIPFYQNISSATQKKSESPTFVTPSPPLVTLPSRNIIADGILTKDSIVEYIQSKNSGIMPLGTIKIIVNLYDDEARKENVNLDIAIAQMCEGTNFLRDQERELTNNYGDLHDIKNTKR